MADVLDAWNEGFSDYLVPVQTTVEKLIKKMERENLDVNASFAYLVDEKIAGVILTGMAEFHGVKQMWIGGMAVVPAYRKKGVAKKMLQQVEAEARVKNCSEILLEVITENAKAYRVYTEFGFEQLNELVVGKLMYNSIDYKTLVRFKASVAAEQDVNEPVDVPWRTRLDKLATVLSIWEEDKQIGYLSFTRDSTRILLLQVELFNKQRADLVSPILQQFKCDYQIEEVWIYNLVGSSMECKQIEKIGLEKPIRQYQMKLQAGKA
nr:GNAT family N-acetyltransferase [Shouchella xiaoxiensis]